MQYKLTAKILKNNSLETDAVHINNHAFSQTIIIFSIVMAVTIYEILLLSHTVTDYINVTYFYYLTNKPLN